MAFMVAAMVVISTVRAQVPALAPGRAAITIRNGQNALLVW